MIKRNSGVMLEARTEESRLAQGKKASCALISRLSGKAKWRIADFLTENATMAAKLKQQISCDTKSGG